MWLKYSDVPILTGEYWDRRQKTYAADEDYRSDFEKPRGCWITDDSEHCWREWCVGERFSLDGLTHKHEVVLDESNVLILRSPYELDDFTREFGGTCLWGPPGEPRKYRNRYIDWQKVAIRYDGLIVTPYQWQRRMELNWYYGWDCASGCIWKASAILDIRLLDVDLDVTKPPAEPDAEAA